MKYKTMYCLHEARMWITTIVSGVVAGAAILAANPELKDKSIKKLNAVKDKVANVFKKKNDPERESVRFVVVDEKGNPLR